MNKFDIFRSAIMAGICIGIAGFGYLVNSTIGMFLFAFGLAAVVQYKLKLFTGTAGFVESKSDLLDLLIILAGNVVGCLCVALLSRCSTFELQIAAETLLDKRLANGALNASLLSIGCGFLMTTAVTFARKSKEFADWLPLLFAVPMFILCGFPHCIADTFYYLCCSPKKLLSEPMFPLLYAGIITGNFIGCNLYRLLIKVKSN